MIDAILKINGARMYEVHSATITKNPTSGSKIKTYSLLTQVYAVIQPTGTTNNVRGLTLDATANSGDAKKADAVMYSKIERFEKERIIYHNIFYEIRSVEYYNNGILKFYKSYLVKVDNQ